MQGTNSNKFPIYALVEPWCESNIFQHLIRTKHYMASLFKNLVQLIKYV